MKQSEVMLADEGDLWFERNRDKLGERDPVSEVIEQAALRPKSVLEIGCSNGWRLLKLSKRYGCDVKGLDPSAEAGNEACVPVWRGTADNLPFATDQFDLVVCGFFLYLADPVDYFKIATEVDRVLQDGGHLIIHDFLSTTPYRVPYPREGVCSRHFDPAQLWLAHPGYQYVREAFDKIWGEAVTHLRKDMAGAFPMKEDT